MLESVVSISIELAGSSTFDVIISLIWMGPEEAAVSSVSKVSAEFSFEKSSDLLWKVSVYKK